jgi:hypothetical protein
VLALLATLTVLLLSAAHVIHLRDPRAMLSGGAISPAGRCRWATL